MYDRNRMILPYLLSEKLASGRGCLRALDAKRLIHNSCVGFRESARRWVPNASNAL
jgi:hypothetical protein